MRVLHRFTEDPSQNQIKNTLISLRTVFIIKKGYFNLCQAARSNSALSASARNRKTNEFHGQAKRISSRVAPSFASISL